MSSTTGTMQDPGELPPDLAERRPEVVRRLLERGVTPRTLQALLPDWEPLIEGGTARDTAPQPTG